jgi:hypothetical protein
MEARKFQKAAKELEDEARNRSFWAFSPKCLVIFGGTGGGGVLLYFIIRAII